MADIDTIRTAGNWSDVYVLIDAPSTVYTARASGGIVEAGWIMSFYGGSGTITNCLADMPILIGSSAGASDYGIARLRLNPASGDDRFYVGADPSLNVPADAYLTVLNDLRVWAKHPVGVYIDVGIAYSDELETFVPTPRANGRVRVIRAGETTGFDASGSWVIGSTIASYAWTFFGATSTTGTGTATPTATYDTSGRFRWKLVVAAANGKTAEAYGWVYALGTNLAAEADVLIDNIDITADAGGRTRITMLDRPTITDGARVVIFAEDYYQGVRQSFGPVAYAKNILMVGWIVGESILRDPSDDRVEFEVAGPIELLGETACLPAGLVDPAFPEDGAAELPDWSIVSDLTAAKGLHYLIHYRSNLARVLDVRVEDFEWAVPKLAGTAENLYGQLSEYADRAALSVRADRQGSLFIERDAQLVPLDERAAIPNRCTLVDGDWQGELGIIRRQRGEISIAEVEGSIFSGGTVTPIGGRSPGDIPAHWGGKDDLDEVYASTVNELMELAGLLAGSKNAEIEAVLATLAYNNRLMDVTPRQYVTVTVDGASLACVPRRTTFRRNPSTGFLRVELELEPAGGEWPAVSIEYPGEEIEPVEPPDEPEPPPVPPGDETPVEPEPGVADAVAATAGDIRSTGDLDGASPTWTTEL